MNPADLNIAPAAPVAAPEAVVAAATEAVAPAAAKPVKAVKRPKAAKHGAGAPAAAAPAATETPQAADTSAAATERPRRADKLVRDSFTMPQTDYALIQHIKDRALNFKRPTKKSELLRAGLQALAELDDATLAARLNRLAPLRTGRPKKNHGQNG